MSRMIKSALAALLIAAAIAPAATADPRQQSVRIAYGDLDIYSVDGGQALLKRVEGAARKVCGERWQYSQLSPHGQGKCRKATVASVVGQLGIEMLTYAYTGAYPASFASAR